MNNPKQMQNSELNDKVLLCCCYFVQKYIELDMGKDKKELKDIAHNDKDIETTGVPVIDATASDTINTLQDDGTMTRKSQNGEITKSTRSSKDIKSVKRLQKINNDIKLSKQKEKDKDKEI